MAKSYSYINRNLANISTAFSNYYQDGFVKYLENTTDLIFSIPAICDKVIRFYILNSTVLCQIGTWDGTTFTSITDVLGSYTSTTYDNNGYQIIVESNFIIIVCDSTRYDSNENRKMIIFAKTTFGNYLVSSYTRSTSPASRASLKNMYTDLTGVQFTGLSNTMVTVNNKIFKSKLYIYNRINGNIITTGSDFETIDGLSMSSKRTGLYNVILGAGGAFLPSGYYGENGEQITNSILVDTVTA